jgi:hypothetical protein
MPLDVRNVSSEAKISAGSSRLMPGGLLLSGLLMHAKEEEHASMKPKHDEHQFQLTAQQVKALNLPAFGSFPYLATRVVPALYHLSLLPESFEPELLRHIARRQVAANRLQTCLVFSPDDCLYYEIDGTEFRSDAIPHGGNAVSGKLRLCVEFEPDDELQVRQRLLAAYVEERNRAGGYLVGDGMALGARDATPDEQLHLAGRQTGRVPRSLDQCPTCGEWAGECLDPILKLKGKVVRVHCLCNNDNHCAACGRVLHARKLNANYFEMSEGQIWHVPGFCGLSHRCPEVC